MSKKREDLFKQAGHTQEVETQLEQANGGEGRYFVYNGNQYCDGKPVGEIDNGPKRFFVDSKGRQLYGTKTCYNLVEWNPKKGDWDILA